MAKCRLIKSFLYIVSLGMYGKTIKTIRKELITEISRILIRTVIKKKADNRINICKISIHVSLKLRDIQISKTKEQIV